MVFSFSAFFLRKQPPWFLFIVTGFNICIDIIIVTHPYGMNCFREKAPWVALPDSTITKIHNFFLIQNCLQFGKSRNKQVEKHSLSAILLFTVLNSIGKVSPVYLCDNGRRKEGSPSLFLFHLQCTAKACLFLLIASLLLEPLIRLFSVLEFYYGGVCTLQCYDTMYNLFLLPFLYFLLFSSLEVLLTPTEQE